MDRQADTPGARLALLMRRRGWSAPHLAGLAGGVSASSIRAYVADRTTPRPSHALALAETLGPADGKSLLEAWGFYDLAQGFSERWDPDIGHQPGRAAPAPVAAPAAPDLGSTLSPKAQEVLRTMTAWLTYVEQAQAAGRTAAPPETLPD